MTPDHEAATVRPEVADPTEHLSPDDKASAVEALMREASLAGVRRAAAQREAQPGRCANCGAACLPTAVYCDEDCQADHERRMRLQAMRGHRGSGYA